MTEEKMLPMVAMVNLQKPRGDLRLLRSWTLGWTLSKPLETYIGVKLYET